MFIVFEGPEGAGKSTQIRRLETALTRRGYDVVVTREPGGTSLGERLRDLLLHSDVAPGAVAEAYLMTAARAEHVRRVIQPALERGAIVLCDRFSDSTLAYQGAGRGIPVDELRALQSLAVGTCRPELKLLLDLDVEVGLSRRERGGDTNRIDLEALDFHQRVARWYRSEAAAYPSVWEVVDGAPAEDMVAARIEEIVSARLGAMPGTRKAESRR